MQRHHQDFISDFEVDDSVPWETLNRDDFERIHALPVPAEAQQVIDERDFRYRFLTTAERDQHILKVLTILEEPIVASGPARQEAWERGWDENLAEYLSNNCEERALLPHYYRRGRSVMRLWDDYILPRSPQFEADFLAVVQHVVATAYFKDVPAIYEYGCGPAHNLVAFGRLVPGKAYHGLDWANAPAKILRLADDQSARLNRRNRFYGHVFDMFSPDPGICMQDGSAAFTFGSMEQLGSRHGAFLQFLLSQPASIVVHIEPFSEFRREGVLLDVLADRYARKRNYLQGYLHELDELRDKGKVEILHRKKLLGSAFYDGWCLVAWRRR